MRLLVRLVAFVASRDQVAGGRNQTAEDLHAGVGEAPGSWRNDATLPGLILTGSGGDHFEFWGYQSETIWMKMGLFPLTHHLGNDFDHGKTMRPVCVPTISRPMAAAGFSTAPETCPAAWPAIRTRPTARPRKWFWSWDGLLFLQQLKPTSLANTSS